MKNWTIDQVGSQTGKVMIVTGANAGLGYESALALAKKEATVVMACRNLSKAEAAKAKILQAVPNAKLDIIQMDLTDLESVKTFAKNFLEKYDRLDVLMNNAGVMVPPLTKTVDDFELQMGANYFGHFLLNGLLLERLNATPNARIVMLSSLAHENGAIDFDNLNAEKSYSKIGAYGQSKLACLMHALELQRRLEASGSGTIAVAAHPGVSPTELVRHMSKVLVFVLTPLFLLISHKTSKGALPQLMASLADDVKGGDYFGPTGFNGMKGKPGKVSPKPHAFDEAVAKKLFDVSEELTGFMYKF